jgi:4-amino-4-deoxy-L-arabinose transferase-like glycosyltransferase
VSLAALDRPLPRHAVALLLALAAFALRMSGIGTQPMWFDEAMTVHIVHAPEGFEFVHNSGPMYYVLAKCWGALFGIEPGALRALSALAGALFVQVSFVTARDVFGPRAALATGLVALLSPIHVYYSQEARVYSVLLLELMVAFWLMWRLARRFRFATWAALTVVVAAALDTNYLAVLPLGAAGAAIALPRREDGARPPWLAFAGAFATAGALVVPWLLWWRSHTAFHPRDMDWLGFWWETWGGLGALGTSVEMFALGPQQGHAPLVLKQFNEMPFPEWLRIAALIATAAMLVHGLARLRADSPVRRAAALQCLAAFAGPLLALWLVSLSWWPIYLSGRYDLIGFPGFVLLLGYAVDRALSVRSWAGTGAAAVAIGVLACAMVLKDVRYLDAEPLPDPTRPVAAYLDANVVSGESVFLVGNTAVTILAHLHRAGHEWSSGVCRDPATAREFTCHMLPTSLETAPATAMRYRRAIEDGTLVTDLERLIRAAPTRGVWLVLGAEWRSGDVHMDQLGRRLFSVLIDAGYTVRGGDPSLGTAHLVRR